MSRIFPFLRQPLCLSLSPPFRHFAKSTSIVMLSLHLFSWQVDAATARLSPGERRGLLALDWHVVPSHSIHSICSVQFTVHHRDGGILLQDFHRDMSELSQKLTPQHNYKLDVGALNSRHFGEASGGGELGREQGGGEGSALGSLWCLGDRKWGGYVYWHCPRR